MHIGLFFAAGVLHAMPVWGHPNPEGKTSKNMSRDQLSFFSGRDVQEVRDFKMPPISKPINFKANTLHELAPVGEGEKTADIINYSTSSQNLRGV
jgi:hypothetical protein